MHTTITYTHFAVTNQKDVLNPTQQCPHITSRQHLPHTLHNQRIEHRPATPSCFYIYICNANTRPGNSHYRHLTAVGLELTHYTHIIYRQSKAHRGNMVELGPFYSSSSRSITNRYGLLKKFTSFCGIEQTTTPILLARLLTV